MKLFSFLCNHEDVLKKDGNKLFVECLKCGRESEGVVTGKPKITCTSCGEEAQESPCQFCKDCMQHEQMLKEQTL